MYSEYLLNADTPDASEDPSPGELVPEPVAGPVASDSFNPGFILFAARLPVFGVGE
jgi:hypothetical protein